MEKPAPIENTAHTGVLAAAEAWTSSAASEAWTATKSGARVVGDLATGVVKQAVDHPLQTLGEVAVGIGIGAAVAESGVGAVGVAAIAAVPLAGYGLYEGGKIALNEGVGAIPGHLSSAYRDAKSSVENSLSAVATVYNGTREDNSFALAEQNVQDIGRAVTPFIAGAVGGGGGDLAQGVLRGTGDVLSRLPSMMFEPAYAGSYANSLAVLAALNGPATYGMEAGAAIGFTTQLRTLENQNTHTELGRQRAANQFVDGKLPPIKVEEGPSLVKTWRDLFSRPEDFLRGAKTGKHGYFELQDLGGGGYFAEVTSGPLAGKSAIYKSGDKTFMVDRAGGAPLFEIPIHE